MTDTKFTPGPWRVIDDHPTRACLHIGSPNDRYNIGDVATVYCAGHNNWDFDAKLIAAAPDLYAALERAAYILSFLVEEYPGYAKSMHQANAALAKARGGLSDD